MHNVLETLCSSGMRLQQHVGCFRLVVMPSVSDWTLLNMIKSELKSSKREFSPNFPISLWDTTIPLIYIVSLPSFSRSCRLFCHDIRHGLPAVTQSSFWFCSYCSFSALCFSPLYSYTISPVQQSCKPAIFLVKNLRRVPHWTNKSQSL